jgi:hypothetical protein
MRLRAVAAEERSSPRGGVIDQLVEIGDQLEAATTALRNLVEELRADLPPDISQKS